MLNSGNTGVYELTKEQKAAAAGARKMDEFDAKWFENIDLDHVDVGSVNDCIDAQANDTTEAYSATSLEKLGVRNEDAHRYGFSATSPHLYGDLAR